MIEKEIMICGDYEYIYKGYFWRRMLGVNK